MNGWTDILDARPSFFEGLARVLDLGGTLQSYNYGDSPDNADARALTADWYALGGDFHTALKQWLADEENQSLGEYLREHVHDLDVEKI